MDKINESYQLKKINGNYNVLEEMLRKMAIKSVNSDNAVQFLMPGEVAIQLRTLRTEGQNAVYYDIAGATAPDMKPARDLAQYFGGEPAQNQNGYWAKEILESKL